MDKVGPIISAVSAVLFLLIIQGCNNASLHEQDREAIARLARSLKFSEIAARFENYNWQDLTDPSLLMFYVEAVVEQKKSLPADKLVLPSTPTRIRNFATGYYDLLEGRHKYALSAFSTIPDVGWRNIGIMEVAIHTRSEKLFFDALEDLLKAEKTEGSQIPEWAIPHYRAISSLIGNDSDTLEKILNETKDVLAEDFYLELFVRKLVMQNRLEEAESAVDSIPSKFAENQNMIVLRSEVMDLRSGPEKSAEYLRMMSERYPAMWIVRQRYAHALIRAGKIDKGIQLLKQLALSRPFDVMSRLDLLETMIDYEKVQNAVAIMRSIEIKQLVTPYIHVIRAKVHIKAGRIQRARQEFGMAKSLAPRNVDVLWLGYDIAQLSKDGDAMKAALEQILKVEPHDTEALASMAMLYRARKQKDLFERTIKAIRGSKRYIREIPQWVHRSGVAG